MRVLERREHLALGAEAAGSRSASMSEQRITFSAACCVKLAVDPLGQVDRAHAAVSELAEDVPGAEPLAGVAVGGVPVTSPMGAPRKASSSAKPSELLDLAPQLHVAAAGVIEELPASLRRLVDHGLEDVLDAVPAFRLIGGRPADPIRRSPATGRRAIVDHSSRRHSRSPSVPALRLDRRGRVEAQILAVPGGHKLNAGGQPPVQAGRHDDGRQGRAGSWWRSARSPGERGAGARRCAGPRRPRAADSARCGSSTTGASRAATSIGSMHALHVATASRNAAGSLNGGSPLTHASRTSRFPGCRCGARPAPPAAQVGSSGSAARARPGDDVPGTVMRSTA